MRVIKERTDIRECDIGIIEGLPGSNILQLSFDPTSTIIVRGDSSFEVYTQSLILTIDSYELGISNHYHESVYNTGLKYILFNRREKNGRPYSCTFVDRRFCKRIVSIEIWGISNKSILDQSSKEYFQKLVPNLDFSGVVEHQVEMQHIIRLVLENNFSILAISDLPNVLQVRFENSDVSKSWLSNGYCLWNTYA